MRKKFFIVCDKENGMVWYFHNMNNAIKCFYELSKEKNIMEMNGITADELIAKYENFDFLSYNFSITNEKVSVFQQIFSD